jgi:L-alanine-DL-glutamate epimerase-like enolase superfamily enzyme
MAIRMPKPARTEDVPVTALDVSVYRVPTSSPESDGTFEWNSTTMVLVELCAGGKRGIGYTYGHACIAPLIRETLAPLVLGHDAFDVPAAWQRMVHAIRNLGRPGICSMAIAAVDCALWDLKARLLEVPLAKLLGMGRESVPVYGSGGFTSYTDAQLRKQLGGWAEQGITMVKMKIGRDAQRDPARVALARRIIGADVELFVDANGAYTRKQALAMAEKFAEHNVTWFEEPVSSDDLKGLRLLRDRAPAGMAIAAGEYGYDDVYFQRMLAAGAVDVLQADATRCAGITGFLRAAALAYAAGIPFSAHTAPALHLHACCALAHFHSIEYFHDHARIEQMFFDGARVPVNGVLTPDVSRPGIGLELKRADAEAYAA